MSALQLEEPDVSQMRDDWLREVKELMNQLTQWSQQEGWRVTTSERVINEESLGIYTVPELMISTPEPERDQLRVEVKGRGPAAASGRVQILAWPTLFRVHLLYKPGQNAWIIRTDSGNRSISPGVVTHSLRSHATC